MAPVAGMFSCPSWGARLNNAVQVVVTCNTQSPTCSTLPAVACVAAGPKHGMFEQCLHAPPPPPSPVLHKLFGQPARTSEVLRQPFQEVQDSLQKPPVMLVHGQGSAPVVFTHRQRPQHKSCSFTVCDSSLMARCSQCP